MAEELPLRRQLRRPGARRSVRRVVKLSPEQEARLVERAAVLRVSVPRLLIDSALAEPEGRRPVVADPVRAELAAELFGVSRLLGRVSVNINQIARATNATHELQPGTDEALAAVERICERLGPIVDEVEAR